MKLIITPIFILFWFLVSFAGLTAHLLEDLNGFYDGELYLRLNKDNENNAESKSPVAFIIGGITNTGQLFNIDTSAEAFQNIDWKKGENRFEFAFADLKEAFNNNIAIEGIDVVVSFQIDEQDTIFIDNGCCMAPGHRIEKVQKAYKFIFHKEKLLGFTYKKFDLDNNELACFMITQIKKRPKNTAIGPKIKDKPKYAAVSPNIKDKM